MCVCVCHYPLISAYSLLHVALLGTIPAPLFTVRKHNISRSLFLRVEAQSRAVSEVNSGLQKKTLVNCVLLRTPSATPQTHTHYDSDTHTHGCCTIRLSSLSFGFPIHLSLSFFLCFFLSLSPHLTPTLACTLCKFCLLQPVLCLSLPFCFSVLFCLELPVVLRQ